MNTCVLICLIGILYPASFAAGDLGWIIVEVASFIALVVVVPILWLVIGIRLIVARRRGAGSAAFRREWCKAIIAPLAVAMILFTPVQWLPLAARVRMNDGALSAFAQRAVASDREDWAHRCGSVGGIKIEYAFALPGGIYLQTQHDPDGDSGLVLATGDAPPNSAPEWAKSKSLRHLVGHWWTYGWAKY